MNTHHLYRSRSDRMLAGVAGGLAEMWDADPSLVRIVWALLVILTGGIALVVYIVMALVVPDEDDVVLSDPAAGLGDPAAPSPAVAREQLRTARREARMARRAARSRDGRGRSGAVVVGVLFVLLGVWFLIREYLPTVDWDWFWPAALVGLGVVVLALALRPESRDDGRGTAGQGSVPS